MWWEAVCHTLVAMTGREGKRGKLRVRKNGSKRKQHSGWGEGHRGDDGKVPRIKGKSHAYLGEYAVVQGGELPTRR